jgi:hypothetical protein
MNGMPVMSRCLYRLSHGGMRVQPARIHLRLFTRLPSVFALRDAASAAQMNRVRGFSCQCGPERGAPRVKL